MNIGVLEAETLPIFFLFSLAPPKNYYYITRSSFHRVPPPPPPALSKDLTKHLIFSSNIFMASEIMIKVTHEINYNKKKMYRLLIKTKTHLPDDDGLKLKSPRKMISRSAGLEI